MPLPVLIGLNHRTAQVEDREKLHFTSEAVAAALALLAPCLQTDDRMELALLSTCNRTEIYLVAEDPQAAASIAINFLAEHAGLTPNQINPWLYLRHGGEAIYHLMSVAAGLDSIITGEDEILGQVKEAYAAAESANTAGPILSALFRGAITCGKRARSETEIGCLRRSVASVVVALAQEVFPNLESHTALLVGAGKISALTARCLTDAGLRWVVVTNRTFDRADKLARRFGGQAVHFEALPDMLTRADIIICSTGAPHTVLHADAVARAMAAREDRPLLIADLAVPRDVDPQVSAIPNVRLVDIDDLEAQAQRASPLAASTRGCIETIVCEETANFEAWLDSRRFADLICQLQTRAAAVCSEQVEKTTRHLEQNDEIGIRELEIMARSVAARILHAPIMFIKQNHSGLNNLEVERLVRQIFDLPPAQ